MASVRSDSDGPDLHRPDRLEPLGPASQSFVSLDEVAQLGAAQPELGVGLIGVALDDLEEVFAVCGFEHHPARAGHRVHGLQGRTAPVPVQMYPYRTNG